MKRHAVTAIVAASVLAVGIAFMAHESGHAVAGSLAGGSPTWLTATEVQGDFEGLSPTGFVALGASGSLANALFCFLGWCGLRRKSATAELRLSAWFFFAVNGMLLAMKAIGEPVAGWGDWMTILRPFGTPMPLRIAVAALGAVALVFLVRRSGDDLAKLLPPGESAQRVTEARRVVWIGAVAAGVLALGANVANPVSTTRGLLLGLAAGLGPFFPMIFAARFASRVAPRDDCRPAIAKWPWLGAAGATTAIMWFVFGPGIRL